MVCWIILGSDDSFARISYSSLMARTDEANIPRCERISWWTCFLRMPKKVAGGLRAWIRKEEGSLFEAGGIYKTLAYLSSEGTKFLFIIPFTWTIWTKGKSFRTPGETYINVLKPENASQGSPSFGVPLRFSSMISFYGPYGVHAVVFFHKTDVWHISARWRLRISLHQLPVGVPIKL